MDSVLVTRAFALLSLGAASALAAHLGLGTDGLTATITGAIAAATAAAAYRTGRRQSPPPVDTPINTHFPLITYTVDDAGTIIEVSDAFVELMGYTPEQLVGSPIFRFMDEGERIEARFDIERYCVDDGGRERVYRHADGSRRNLRVYACPYQAASGAKVLAVMAIDSGAERRADIVEKLADDTFAANPVPMFRADRSGEITELNSAFRTLLAIPEGLDLRDLNVAEPISVSAKRLARSGQGSSLRTKETFFTVDGEARDVILFTRCCAPDVHGVRRIEGTAIDMTEQFRVERLVQASRARFRRLYDETPVVLVSTDGDGKVTDANSYALKRFHVDRTQLVGASLTSLIAEDEREHMEAKLQETLAGAKWRSIETLCVDQEGESFPARLYLNPRPARSASEAMAVTLLDLTEIREAERERDEVEQRLRVAERLEAVGQLAAAVAHEINTPSQYVLDNLQFLQEAGEKVQGWIAQASQATSVDDDLQFYLDESPAAIEQSLEGMRQIAKIVGAMKRLTHPGDDAKKSETNLNELIESVCTVSRGEWKHVADISLDLQDDLDCILCDPSAINQVLLNMVVNSAHAIAEKGTKAGKGMIRVVTRQADDAAEIVIEDTGCGIPRENLDRVLNPFFTTKEVGKGTGQGLAIAHRIVTEEHQGSLEIASEVGAWTRFTIRLPQQPAQEAA
ncbi:MAG: PAS domain S-box protein [Pseudomonadota bacterium]